MKPPLSLTLAALVAAGQVRGDARDGCRYATLSVYGRKPRDVLACPTGRGDWRFRRT